MRKATLFSNPSTDDGTFGVILTDDHVSFSTGELPWRDNKGGVSCIPAGVYTCKKYNSPKHGESYLLSGVKGRDMIEIHSANFMGDQAKGKFSQLLGCIALGMQIGPLEPHPGMPKQIAVLSSKQAVDSFEKHMGMEDFQLTVIRG